jgi:Na+/phosphate symporter
MDLDISQYFDIKKLGWCTPTLLTAILGTMSVVILLSQLAANKNPKKTKAIASHLVFHMIWTIFMVFLMFWLCENGKLEASWWIFGIFYILPCAIAFIYLMYVFYIEMQEIKKLNV